MKNLSKFLENTDLKDWCLRHVPTIDSTNIALLLEGKTISNWRVPVILLADHQTSGHGRNGRKWVTMPGDSILCSIGITIPLEADKLIGLPLAISFAISEALENFFLIQLNFLKSRFQEEIRSGGEIGFKLKWPNDILLFNRKLAGVLVEIAKSNINNPNTSIFSDREKQFLEDDPSSRKKVFCYTNVVIGFGINVISPDRLKCFDLVQSGLSNKISRKESKLRGYANPAYLDELIDGPLNFKVDLLGQILQSINKILQQFNKDGFSSIQKKWWKRHVYYNEEVNIYENDKFSFRGKAIGVDQKGRLLVEVGKSVRAIMSGDIDNGPVISLRPHI